MIPIGSVDMPVTPPDAAPQSLIPMTRSGDPRSPEAVGTKFESMFLSQILKEMRDTLEPDGLFPEDNGDVYGGLFDMFLGQHLAQAGGLGLARIVKRHLETLKKMSTLEPQQLDPAHADLALNCLKHLEQEEVSLCAVRDALEQTRTALVEGQFAPLIEAVKRQVETARIQEEMRLRREQLCLEMADTLGRPPVTVTLKQLAELVPGALAQRLLGCRLRLCDLARDIDALNRTNALLANHSLSFIQDLLAGILGTGASGKRYGPAGAVREHSSGSLVSARG